MKLEWTFPLILFWQRERTTYNHEKAKTTETIENRQKRLDTAMAYRDKSKAAETTKNRLKLWMQQTLTERGPELLRLLKNARNV